MERIGVARRTIEGTRVRHSGRAVTARTRGRIASRAAPHDAGALGLEVFIEDPIEDWVVRPTRPHGALGGVTGSERYHDGPVGSADTC